jgi:hypothetical protein
MLVQGFSSACLGIHSFTSNIHALLRFPQSTAERWTVPVSLMQWSTAQNIILKSMFNILLHVQPYSGCTITKVFVKNCVPLECAVVQFQHRCAMQLWQLKESIHCRYSSDHLMSHAGVYSKAILVTGWGGPWGCEKLRLHVFYTIGSQMVVGLSASCPGCPLPPERFLVLISARGWVNPGAIVQLEGSGQFKNPVTSLGI